MVELIVESINMPKECNLIFGHSHFIKTAEDLYSVLAESSTGIKFGLAFCEASGLRLVRSEGNDTELKKAAEQEALKIGAGHCFIIFLKEAFPINVLNALKNTSEVCRIFCATANPVQVILAKTNQGKAVLGIVDGQSPLSVETSENVIQRKELLQKFGYRPY
ncbi:MAG: adenosine-specific kinase [Candidatus Micrarchaeia archaeon]